MADQLFLVKLFQPEPLALVIQDLFSGPNMFLMVLLAEPCSDLIAGMTGFNEPV